MSKYTLPLFGELDLDSLEDYYEAEFEYEDRTFYVNLNFDEEKLEENRLHFAMHFLQNLPSNVTQTDNAVWDDFKSGGTAKDYIDHHLEVIPQDELDEILKHTDKNQSEEIQLFSILQLYRIGIYPENGDNYIVMDYNIGVGVTDYVVVVNINVKGQIKSIEMES